MNYVFSRFRFRRELILKLIINLLVDSLILQGLDQMLIAEIFGEWQLPFLMEAVTVLLLQGAARTDYRPPSHLSRPYFSLHISLYLCSVMAFVNFL